MRYFRTLKFKILAICLSLSLVMTGLLSFVIYRDVERTYREREIQYSSLNMKMVMNNIDRDYSQVVNFLLWLSSSKDLAEFLTFRSGSQSAADYQKITAYNAVQTQIRSMDLMSAIDKCLITNLQGDFLVLGRNHGDISDFDIIRNYQIDLNANVQVGSFIASPFRYGNGETGVLIVCGVYDVGYTQLLGGAYVFLSSEVLDTQFAQYLAGDNAQMYLATESGFYPVSDRILENAPRPSFQMWDIGAVGDAGANAFTARGNPEGREINLLGVRSSLLQWTLVRELSDYTVRDVSDGLLDTLLILVAVVFGSFALMMLLLARIINRPVRRICNRIELISSGDFSRDHTIETGDELGYIGQGVNSMSAEIEKLIEAYLEEQQQKKNYEFKVLQTQINPHFLYNTLNSIKWMASIQRSKGIVEMVSTLAHMLRLIAKVNTEIVTLQKELEFVRDYIVIQSYRYGDSFTVEYDIPDESLLLSRVIKFTIQPLVENAIFHGVEPKNAPCTIRVSARRREDSLYLEVRDDGVGLSEEMLQKLNSFSQETTKVQNHIGLFNIHHRIQLEYGEEYGLQVDSEEGKFTRVTIHIPYIPQEKTAAEH